VLLLAAVAHPFRHASPPFGHAAIVTWPARWGSADAHDSLALRDAQGFPPSRLPPGSDSPDPVFQTVPELVKAMEQLHNEKFNGIDSRHLIFICAGSAGSHTGDS